MKRINIIFTSIVAVCSLLAASMNDYRTLGVIQEVAPLSCNAQDRGVSTLSRVHLASEDDFIKDLRSNGYILLEIEVRNQTNKAYDLSKESISLPQATTKDIAWSFTKKSIPRSIGLKIASFFFWPMMIPSSIDTLVTHRNHRSLKYDLKVKTLKAEGETLLPYTAAKRFIFIKESDWAEWNKKNSFEITLKETESPRLLIIPTPLETFPS
jgi:hypothetical protein